MSTKLDAIVTDKKTLLGDAEVAYNGQVSVAAASYKKITDPVGDGSSKPLADLETLIANSLALVKEVTTVKQRPQIGADCKEVKVGNVV